MKDARAMTLSVIAPCFNEEGNIACLVERVASVFEALPCRRTQLVLVDDGSSDGTWGEIEHAAEEHANVVGVRHATNCGMVQAWRTGLARCDGNTVCLIDADLQNRPEDIPRLLSTYLARGADVVQGVRRAAEGVTRLALFSRGLNWLLNAAFGTNLRDNKSGFLLCAKETMESILDHRWNYKYFQSFVGVSAIRRGFVIGECDTTFEARHAGRSFLSRFPLLVSARIVWELLKFRLEVSLPAWKRESATQMSAKVSGQWALPAR